MRTAALLGHYAACSCNSLLTFRGSQSVTSSRFKILDHLPLKMERLDCPEMSATDYYYKLRNDSEERSSQVFQ